LSYAPTESHDEHGEHRERGFLVRDTLRSVAIEAARTFDQRAVVFGHDGKVGLLYPRTERWMVMPIRTAPDLVARG
jgi:hypothetical protein